MAIEGNYEVIIKTPMGNQKGGMTLGRDGDTLTGEMTSSFGSTVIEDGKVDGDTLTFKISIKSPMPMTLDGEATVDGDTLNGNVTAGAFGSFPFSGAKA